MRIPIILLAAKIVFLFLHIPVKAVLQMHKNEVFGMPKNLKDFLCNLKYFRAFLQSFKSLYLHKMNDYSQKVNTMKTADEVLLFLLKNFQEKSSINQVAKSVKKAPSGVFKELAKLEKTSIVLSKKIGNAKIYELNLESMETRKKCELLLLGEKNKLLKNPLASLLAKDLVKLEKYSDIIAIFGSVLEKAEPRDIDVFIATKPKFVNAVEKICNEISVLYNKSISPLILSYPDFVANLKKSDEVILNIVKRGVVLNGYEKFVEGIRNAKV